MGAWGYRHFDTDDALDWLGEFVELPIALVIRGTLREFLKRKRTVKQAFCRTASLKDAPKPHKIRKAGRRGGHNDVVAAAALLDDLTSYDTSSTARICLRGEAEESGLYSLAAEAVREALDDPWIEEWELESEKRKQLASLITSLKRKARNERGRSRISGRRK